MGHSNLNRSVGLFENDNLSKHLLFVIFKDKADLDIPGLHRNILPASLQPKTEEGYIYLLWSSSCNAELG